MVGVVIKMKKKKSLCLVGKCCMNEKMMNTMKTSKKKDDEEEECGRTRHQSRSNNPFDASICHQDTRFECAKIDRTGQR